MSASAFLLPGQTILFKLPNKLNQMLYNDIRSIIISLDIEKYVHMRKVRTYAAYYPGASFLYHNITY